MTERRDWMVWDIARTLTPMEQLLGNDRDADFGPMTKAEARAFVRRNPKGYWAQATPPRRPQDERRR